MEQKTIDILTRRFDADQIKTRRGRGGQQLSYVEGHTVIGRLNEAFAHAWSFEVVSSQVLDEEVVVCGRLTASGSTKEAYGGQTRQNGTAVADVLKGAATDALKKAATLFGVGLHLYGAVEAPPRKELPEQSEPEATERQLTICRRLARELDHTSGWFARKCMYHYGTSELSQRQAAHSIDCMRDAIDKRDN